MPRLLTWLWCLAALAAAAVWQPAAAATPAEQVEAALLARQQRLLGLVNTGHFGGFGRKNSPYDVLAFTAANGCGPERIREFMSSLASPDLNPDPKDPIEIFALPPLVRYLFQFGQCLSPAQKARLLTGLTRPQRLFSHGTTNHAVLQSTSWYLLAQYFPEATWHDFNGKPLSSAQLMARLKPLLLGRVGAFYQQGHIEWLSPTYAVVNLFPMLNLFDFAQDPLLRKAGAAEAVLEVSLLKAHSFHGVLVPPLTRKNAEQHNGPDVGPNEAPSVSQHVLWFYFGEPADLSASQLRSSKEPMYAVMLALSAWRPPPALHEWAEHLKRGYRIATITPQFASWDQITGPYIKGDAFISDAYALSAASVFFNPGGYEEHIQAFGLMYRSEDTDNQVSCYHPYFNSNLGEDAWSTDRWSPFQQAVLIDAQSAVLLFDVPVKDPWGQVANTHNVAKRSQHRDSLLPLFQCRVPEGMDSVHVDGRGVYMREGSTWMALLGLHAEPEVSSGLAAAFHGYRSVKWRQRQGGVFVWVQPDAVGMGLEAFKALVKAKAPRWHSSPLMVSLSEKSSRQTGIARIAFQMPELSNLAVPRWSEAAVFGLDSKPLPAAIGSTAILADPAVTISLKNGMLRLGGPGQPFSISFVLTPP